MSWGKRVSRILKMSLRINKMLAEHKMNMVHQTGVYTLTNRFGAVELSTLDIRKVDKFLSEKSELTAQITFDNIESK